jgi:exodeoxyribonuclease VII large subunit
MTETITYLTTSFQEKEQVKSLGAKWDVTAKKWYVPEGIDLAPFKNWLANTQIPTYPSLLHHKILTTVSD